MHEFSPAYDQAMRDGVAVFAERQLRNSDQQKLLGTIVAGGALLAGVGLLAIGAGLFLALENAQQYERRVEGGDGA